MPHRNAKTNDLFKAILQLKSVEECQDFFRDLLTLEELEEATKRWQVAQKLAEGEPYRAIADEVGVSTATVTRVAQWLNNGEGGYELILKRLGKMD